MKRVILMAAMALALIVSMPAFALERTTETCMSVSKGELTEIMVMLEQITVMLQNFNGNGRKVTLPEKLELDATADAFRQMAKIPGCSPVDKMRLALIRQAQNQAFAGLEKLQVE